MLVAHSVPHIFFLLLWLLDDLNFDMSGLSSSVGDLFSQFKGQVSTLKLYNFIQVFIVQLSQESIDLKCRIIQQSFQLTPLDVSDLDIVLRVSVGPSILRF